MLAPSLLLSVGLPPPIFYQAILRFRYLQSTGGMLAAKPARLATSVRKWTASPAVPHLTSASGLARHFAGLGETLDSMLVSAELANGQVNHHLELQRRAEWLMDFQKRMKVSVLADKRGCDQADAV